MASTITNYSSLIDTNYPVAGADNDLHGFHAIFTNIKNSLVTANQELISLNTNGVFLTDDNTFSGTITNATITNCTIILKGYSS